MQKTVNFQKYVRKDLLQMNLNKINKEEPNLKNIEMLSKEKIKLC